MKLNRLFSVVMLLVLQTITVPVFAKPSNSTATLLLRFDNEHDLSKKEQLLGVLTNQDAEAGPFLLRLARSTRNADTRWMAMRGMVSLHYVACAPFLEACLNDTDALVRANVALFLGDLRVNTASGLLLKMFAVEQQPPALQQASLALRVLKVSAAAPYVREKIPNFTGQTRAWLIQALGTLGSIADVPRIAAYLDEMTSSSAAAEAIQELTGVNFGPQTLGLTGYPPKEVIAAQSWWRSHKRDWPHCADCRTR